LPDVSGLFLSTHLLAAFYDIAKEVHKAEKGEVVSRQEKLAAHLALHYI
jgi:hypothetical protein